MKRTICLLAALFLMTGPLWADDCAGVLQELKLPKKVKTRGKPKVAKWEDVDKILSQVSKLTEGKACTFSVDQLFATKKDDIFFPLSNSVIRVAPEHAFEGIQIFAKEGDEIGKFLGRVKYERSGGLYASGSYELYYFQYEDAEGGRFTVGNRLLLGDYVVRWNDVKDIVIFDSQPPSE